MDRRKNRDLMNVNIGNVFASDKSTHHMSEEVYDVDYTKRGDAPIEMHEDITLLDMIEKKELNIFDDEED